MQFPSAEQLKKDIEELTTQMSDSATAQNPGLMKELAQSMNDKRDLLELMEQYEAAVEGKAQAEEMLTGDDEEMRALAEEELAESTAREEELRGQIEEMLIPKDPRDARDVILEIRAGAGGEEAALFASELFRAYVRYGEQNNWKTNIASSSPAEQGGFKEVVAEMTGKNVFGALKFEMGVHRVQRIPETEKQGRVHTSTVTVAVMPVAEDVDLEINTEDLRIDTYRSGGAGGQHLNKTSSAVRITHLPTNTVVAVQDERSQHKNKDKAMKILRTKLLEQREEEQRAKQAAERAGQVGTGDRSEKIRTYNFPQDRITDHRIKESWSNIPAVMEGGWDAIFSAMLKAQREAALQNSA